MTPSHPSTPRASSWFSTRATEPARWTLKLLADRIVALTDHETLSAETIRRGLLEKDLEPWQKKMWCLREMGAAFVAQMEHIFDENIHPADLSGATTAGSRR